MTTDTLTESQTRLGKLLAQLKDKKPDARANAASRLKMVTFDDKGHAIDALKQLALAARDESMAGNDGEHFRVYQEMCCSGASLYSGIVRDLTIDEMRDLKWYNDIFMCPK